MITTINGTLFRALLDSGIRNLALHGKEVNDLNVFPVPDGDTGTNMVLTLRNGFGAVEESEDLRGVAEAFSVAVVYGARGNSGVIISRFFKGFSDTLAKAESNEADAVLFSRALCHGTEEAYLAVSHPTEGTMLTVLREASASVRAHCENTLESDLLTLVKLFLDEANASLRRTPELLPVLKNAGVVDSGGAGVVYVFEGMYKCLCGEPIAAAMPAYAAENTVDYSKFDRNSRFEYGYCTEFLLQITAEKAEGFDPDAFKAYLEGAGDSVATTFDRDKVKVHIHTKTPADILAEAHRYGEFLALKIENMSVQHSAAEEQAAEESAPEEDLALAEESATICLPDVKRESAVGIVVCAPDRKTAELFFSMGADAVICCPSGVAPTTKDFADAVTAAGAESTVIFPNNKNYALSASKAAELLSEKVSVVRSGSIAECYAALAMLDFDAEDAERVAEDACEAIGNLYTVTVKQAVKDAVCDGITVCKGDYIAMDAEGVSAADEELWELAKKVMNAFVEEHGEPDAVTVFTGKNTPEGLADMIVKRVDRKYKFTETDIVETDSEIYELILSFE
ncbi:MAG: DAK2 domain-containing protein [Clostridia bacterium]|nr:DAK2 domain-containing protein [Clostridia bacterium]